MLTNLNTAINTLIMRDTLTKTLTGQLQTIVVIICAKK